jgi:hypothetical protein
MQSNNITDARTQRRERRQAVRDLEFERREAVRASEFWQRSFALDLQNRQRDNRRLAAQPLGMLQVREQSIGRIIPFTGLTRRPQRGLYQPRTWTVLFTQILRSMLAGSLTREQQDQVIIATDNRDDRDEIVIDLQEEDPNVWEPVGAQKGRLSITVNQGNPRHGFSKKVSDESDWRGRVCRTERTPRIELAPYMEITHRILPLDQQNLRFRDFLSWEHGVDLIREAGRYKVYHADYNWAYPVLKIVSEVIKEHCLRRDLPGPDAPWDA